MKNGTTTDHVVWFSTPVCPYCRMRSVVRVNEERLKRWKEGEFIQVAFPDLSADVRELMMTGFHAGCWDKVFSDD